MPVAGRARPGSELPRCWIASREVILEGGWKTSPDPSDGKNVTISGLSAAVLKDGKLIQHWEFSDDQGRLAQLEVQTR
jgi:hypothetical protein